MPIFSRRLVAKERGIYYMFSVLVVSSFGQCSFGSNSYRTSNNRDINLEIFLFNIACHLEFIY